MRTIPRVIVWALLFAMAFFLEKNLSLVTSNFQNHELLSKLLRTFYWVAGFAIINTCLNKIFWDRIFSRRIDNKIPVLLKYISSFLLAILFLSLIVTQVYGKSITGVLAFSGGFGILLGFTLQNTINDFFSGIIIHMEKPFSIGDFIMLNNTRLGDEPLIGKVNSINWRTSRLQKTDGTMVIVPNNQFTKMVVTNFMLPEEKSRIELEFCVGFEYETERVINILLTALYSVDKILKDPKPKVKVPRTSSDGVIYQVRFWLLPSEISPGRGRDNVNQAVIKYLDYAGISLANERTEIYYAPIKDRDAKIRGKKKKLIRNVPIFKSLSSENLHFLCDQLERIHVKSGETIVQQEDLGDTLFVISEGHSSVYVKTDTEVDEKQVGKLGPGQFFGEMSLVLGEPRSATVKTDSDCYVYKISKETMQALFDKDTDLLDHIVKVIDARKNKNQNILVHEEVKIEAEEDRYQFIKEKIMTLFKLF